MVHFVLCRRCNNSFFVVCRLIALSGGGWRIRGREKPSPHNSKFRIKGERRIARGIISVTNAMVDTLLSALYKVSEKCVPKIIFALLNSF